MEVNDEKELESFLSEDSPTSEPEKEEEEVQVEEEPKEEEEESTEEVEEVEALTEREKALINQFTESQDSSEESFDPSTPPVQTWETQEYRFIKEDESIDDILADPAKFNAKMAELYNAALQRGAQLALEATYRGLPRTVSTYAKQQIETMNTVNSFYESNKDLIPLKPALARIAQKIGTEHPEYNVTQLLSESAKAARTIFKLRETAKRSASPAFVTQKGGTNRLTNKGRETKTIEDEIMDLIS